MMNVDKSDTNQKAATVKEKTTGQFVWGIALVLMGICVFFRIPQVMPKIAEIKQFSSAMFFIRFCFYLMGIMLIGGGSKKIYNYYFQDTDR